MLNISVRETVLGIWNITSIFFVFSQYFIPKKECRRTARFASLYHWFLIIKNVDIDDLAGVVTETPRMAGVAIVFFHGWPHGAALLMVMTPFSHCVWCGSTNHLCHYLPSTWIPYKRVQQKDKVQEAWRIFGNKKVQHFVGCFCETQSECPWAMNW